MVAAQKSFYCTEVLLSHVFCYLFTLPIINYSKFYMTRNWPLSICWLTMFMFHDIRVDLHKSKAKAKAKIFFILPDYST